MVNEATVATSPSVLIDNNNNFWVFFESNRGGFSQIYYVKSIDGGITWSTIIQITDNTNSETYPSTSLDSKGNIYVAFTSNRTGNSDIFLRRSIDGGSTWSSDHQITSNTATDGQSAIKIYDESKIWIAFWSQRGGADENIYYTIKKIEGGSQSSIPGFELIFILSISSLVGCYVFFRLIKDQNSKTPIFSTNK